MTYRKKLIEVALPLDAINRESAREKSIRHGHPSTLHLWWARRPLATCRAVLFAQLVDDPSSHPDKFPTEEAQKKERERLFKIIEDLVKWENINNERVLEAARQEILKSTGGNPPPVLDPFCGGGSIPLEAQRLGLKAYASDLNPVAVLITKALIEIPPKFAGKPPMHPGGQTSTHWHGAKGLAEDVRYYGKWMRDEAEKRIGHLYPRVKLPKEYGGREATVIAWLWARTVKCPNPACGAQMPLVRSFWLSTKKGKKAWIEPIVDRTDKTVRFHVKNGEGIPPTPPKIGRGASFRCLICNQIADERSVRHEFQSKRSGLQLLAIVAEGPRRRLFLAPSDEHVTISKSARPKWKPEEEMNQKTSDLVSGRGYGFTHWYELFTSRQLVGLTTFSDLVVEARERIKEDAIKAGMLDDGRPLKDGGTGAAAYADAAAIYLGMVVSRISNTISSLAIWSQSREQSINVFSRQALPMTWDFPEVNPFAGAAGDFCETASSMAKSIEAAKVRTPSYVFQLDATSSLPKVDQPMVVTDPPYYDNISYADLSDYFYIWLRRSLGKIFPDLFSTLLVPKAQELVATPYRFGGDKGKARHFFEKGLEHSFSLLRQIAHRDYPFTLYYAFKQAELDSSLDDGNGHGIISSTGWETMLEGLLRAGLAISRTWPMRTERPTGMKVAVNALASSILIVCSLRPSDAPMTTRRDFLNSLKKEMSPALNTLQQGNIAPVDLAQSAIGPGMAVFSRYSKVLEADGTPMKVRSALALINQELDEYLTEQEGDYDADTRWALAWFEQQGMEDGPYGVAETLSKAKNTAVDGLVEAGIIVSKAGKVRILRRDELPEDWDPAADKRLTVWEVTQHLIRALVDKGSEEVAAALLKKVGALGDVARDLAYRLYTICDRKKWAQEALAYNSLVVAWPELVKLAGKKEMSGPSQQELTF
ncbi:MAG: DUF1156 domain-containing protein [Proteobacteria bacterium]|nr:DUF1156 domain-containing protein [Pseudomonadota bacterium]